MHCYMQGLQYHIIAQTSTVNMQTYVDKLVEGLCLNRYMERTYYLQVQRGHSLGTIHECTKQLLLIRVHYQTLPAL